MPANLAAPREPEDLSPDLVMFHARRLPNWHYAVVHQGGMLESRSWSEFDVLVCNDLPERSVMTGPRLLLQTRTCVIYRHYSCQHNPELITLPQICDTLLLIEVGVVKKAGLPAGLLLDISRQPRISVMHFLVVYAHPIEGSFQSAIHRGVVNALTGAGHQVDDCDLYLEGFQPVLGQSELSRYPDASQNHSIAPREVERLLKCEGLVFIFPTWWYGMPAILKGYFDRVWLPGVAFEISGARTIPLLTSIVRLGVVTTFGSPWWINSLYLGNPNRKILMRGVRRLISPKARTLWLAQYGMDYINETKRENFLHRVAHRFASF